MAGPIDPRTLAIIQAMAPAAEQRQALMARDAVMRGSAPKPMQPVFRPGMDAAPAMPAGLTIAPQGGMPPGFDEFADVRNPPIPQPRGPMTAPQPSVADLMPPQAAPGMAPMPQSFETPIGPAPSRFVPPPGNMLAPDIETGSIAPMPAPLPAPAPAGNRLAAEPPPAPMPAPVEPAGNMLAAPMPTGRRVYDPAAGTNQPRFITEGPSAPMAARGAPSAPPSAAMGYAPAAGAGGAAMAPAGVPDSGGGMGDGFFDFLGGFSRGGLLGGIQGVHLGKKAREKAGADAQKQQQGLNMTVEAARRLGIPNDMITALTATGNTKALADVIVDVHKQRMQPTDPSDRYKTVGGMIFDAETQQFIQPPEGADGGSSTEYGLNPQFGVDASGNPVAIQFGKDGKAVQTALPEGVTISRDPIRFDAGTKFILLDPITRQPIGEIPKEIAAAETEKARGKAEGEAIASAPMRIENADQALTLIDGIRKHPARKNWIGGTGATSFANAIPGTDGYDFQSRVDQLKGGAFLTAIERMVGMGALSNQEGATATSAITRLNTALSNEDFEAALTDYENAVKTGRDRAARRLRYDGKPMDAGSAPAAPAGSPSDNDPLGIR